MASIGWVSSDRGQGYEKVSYNKSGYEFSIAYDHEAYPNDALITLASWAPQPDGSKVFKPNASMLIPLDSLAVFASAITRMQEIRLRNRDNECKEEQSNTTVDAS